MLPTTDVPVRGGRKVRGGRERALQLVTGAKKPIKAVIEILKPAALDQVRALGEGDCPTSPGLGRRFQAQSILTSA